MICSIRVGVLKHLVSVPVANDRFLWPVRIVGLQADSTKKKTKIIEDDWTPVCDEEFTFAFTAMELALLQIEVREYDICV